MNEAQNSPGDAPRPTLSAEFLHELRTPLNHIIGYSEMLTEQAQDEGQDGFVPDLQEIHAAAMQLRDLLVKGEPLSKGSSDAKGRSIVTPLATPVSVEFPASDTAPALILVVDDNERNRDMLSRRLQKQGYDVAVAVNGQEAMEAVRTRPFDMVLLDIMMPEIDGYEVLRQLKADETLRDIPVIMISALDEMDSVVRCIEMGAEDYLPKPFNATLLKARIGACLEKKHVRDLALRFTSELQEKHQKLQELEKQRDDLTHMIVHDLRTPLTSVIAGMQTIEAVGELDEMQREMVDISIGGGEALLGMINDLLDVEQLESGSMRLDYVPLEAAELVAAATAQVASLVALKNLTIIRQLAPDLPPFSGDENKLRRILVNLLGNAIKFTPAGGTVTIEVRPGESSVAARGGGGLTSLPVEVQPGESGQSLVFSVSDTGEGIPPEAFERIFEKFGQVESRQGGRVMSTGLGLTFCKLAVEAHGGEIGVTSVTGEGSTFRFTIPVREPQ